MVVSRLSEEVKLTFAFFVPVVLFLVMLLFYSFSGVSVFYGSRGEALDLLGMVVQCLSAVAAIVFSLLLVVVQITLGKYTARVVDYVFLGWKSLFVLYLYLETIVYGLYTMWTINSSLWLVGVNTTLTLALICIGSLLPYFILLSGEFSVINIMGRVQSEILGEYCKGRVFQAERKMRLLVTLIRSALREGEDDYASYGISLIVETVKSVAESENKSWFLMSVKSLLDDIAEEGLRSSEVVEVILEAYEQIVRKLNFDIFITSDILVSIVNLYRYCLHRSPLTIRGKVWFRLVSRAFFISIEAYKVHAMSEDYFLAVSKIEKYLREILRELSKGTSEIIPGVGLILIYIMSMDTCMELLRKGKLDGAVHLVKVVVEETTMTSEKLCFLVELAIKSRVEGFYDFSVVCVEELKKLKRLKIEVEYDSEIGRMEITVGNGFVHVKTGNVEEHEAVCWLKSKVEEE